jgi:hypothetical protein
MLKFNIITKILILCNILNLGCGYHRLDRRSNAPGWLKKGETVRIDTFTNNTQKLGIEEVFRKALENRIILFSPWILQPAHSANARWVVQATIERYNIRPLGLMVLDKKVETNSLPLLPGIGSSNRYDISITVSLRLLDGITGEVIVTRPGLTFSHQYRTNSDSMSSYYQESSVSPSMLDFMANDFAESFLIQIFEGTN